MNSLVFVREQRFDLSKYEPSIHSIRQRFDRYLDDYPVKGARSKHSLLGPVGKILREAKTDRWDAASLAGFALNIHLANPRASNYISPDAREALEIGTRELIDLLRGLPPSAQDKVLDRLDYGLYFMRRTKSMEYLERIRDEFATFLRQRYANGSMLATAWAEEITRVGENFERVPYPSRNLFRTAKGRKRDDIAAFVQEAELKGYAVEDEETSER